MTADHIVRSCETTSHREEENEVVPKTWKN